MREFFHWVEQGWKVAAPWYWGLGWVLRIALTILVIKTRRSVPSTLAWLLLFFALPVPGAFIYLLVGENRLGRWRNRERSQVWNDVAPALSRRWESLARTVNPRSLGGLAPVARIGAAVGGLRAVGGNTLRLIRDPDEYLSLLLDDIDRAHSHCHLLYYIWMKGGRAEQVGEALIRAAARGVECKVLVDDVGSRTFLRSAMAERLVHGGVRVRRALPAGLLRLALNRLDLRNHRKIAVFDGLAAYMGSQNLTDNSYHYRKAKKLGPWIDASVRVEGPAVQALALAFLADWAAEEAVDVPMTDRYLPPTPRERGAAAVAQVVPTGPHPASRAEMREAVLTTIYAAVKDLIISTPYFIPDEATTAALRAAARRGVEVTLILPRASDHPIVDQAGRAHYADLLDAGVRIHLFRHGLLHSKTMTADGKLAMIGSANLDTRSFWLNYEVSLFAYDQAFAAQLVALQRHYLAQSDALDPAAWTTRGRWPRVQESVARLFGPLL